MKLGKIDTNAINNMIATISPYYPNDCYRIGYFLATQCWNWLNFDERKGVIATDNLAVYIVEGTNNDETVYLLEIFVKGQDGVFYSDLLKIK